MCLININQDLTRSKVLISFGAIDGGFELAWDLKRRIDEVFGDNAAYIDAVSLEHDPFTSYNWDQDLAIYKMSNPNWETYFRLTMKHCDTMILLITMPWLQSQWCIQELSWLIDELKTRDINVIPVVFEDALTFISDNHDTYGIFGEFIEVNHDHIVYARGAVVEINKVEAMVNGRVHVYHYKYAVSSDVMDEIFDKIIPLPVKGRKQ